MINKSGNCEFKSYSVY